MPLGQDTRRALGSLRILLDLQRNIHHSWKIEKMYKSDLYWTYMTLYVRAAADLLDSYRTSIDR
jgi:hypothetical protein